MEYNVSNTLFMAMDFTLHQLPTAFPKSSTPAQRIDHGNLELLQWIGFASMACDHVGAVFLSQHSWLRFIGRLAFPLFALVFAWRIAVAVNHGRSLFPAAVRLVISGAISQVLWIALGFGSTLNIMFTFATCLAIIELCDVKREALDIPPDLRFALAVLLAMLASDRVDFGFPGMSLILCLYAFCRWGDRAYLAASGLSLFVVAYAVSIHSALLAVPLAGFVVQKPWGVRRFFEGQFYWLYPLHLLILVVFAVIAQR